MPLVLAPGSRAAIAFGLVYHGDRPRLGGAITNIGTLDGTEPSSASCHDPRSALSIRPIPEGVMLAILLRQRLRPAHRLLRGAGPTCNVGRSEIRLMQLSFLRSLSSRYRPMHRDAERQSGEDRRGRRRSAAWSAPSSFRRRRSGLRPQQEANKLLEVKQKNILDRGRAHDDPSGNGGGSCSRQMQAEGRRLARPASTSRPTRSTPSHLRPARGGGRSRP